MRKLFVMMLLLSPLGQVQAQVSIQIGLPSITLGFNQPVYPQLVAVPGYPVYYDPGAGVNLFFYDGLYWVYAGDGWYASAWYNGPWDLVEPGGVPLFILRVPVRYYRQPPRYFLGWQADESPRWGERWGHEWERQHSGWDRWDRRAVPPPAPLPTYQRQYSGDRYPRGAEQHALRDQHYRHEPRDAAVTRVYQAQVQHAASPRAGAPPHAAPAREPQHPAQAKEPQHAAPVQQPQHPAQAKEPQRAAPVQQPQHPAPVHEPQARPQAQEQDRREQGKKGDERGHDHEN